MPKKCKAELTTIRLTLDVKIHANGEDPKYLKDRMTGQFQQAIGCGAITGTTAAEVDDYKLETTLLEPQAASLVECQVTAWLTDLMMSGNMKLGDIPQLMARYALTDPADMRSELAERMGLV